MGLAVRKHSDEGCQINQVRWLVECVYCRYWPPEVRVDSSGEDVGEWPDDAGECSVYADLYLSEGSASAETVCVGVGVRLAGVPELVAAVAFGPHFEIDAVGICGESDGYGGDWCSAEEEEKAAGERDNRVGMISCGKCWACFVEG